jgi:bacillithiol biosynthesis cysteine-adding enzyme BshC
MRFAQVQTLAGIVCRFPEAAGLRAADSLHPVGGQFIQTFCRPVSLIRVRISEANDSCLTVPAEESRVIPDCIPFSAIPHTTKLFSDYLSQTPEIRKFFPHAADPSHIASLTQVVPSGTEIHRRVADVLERQNRAWGASEATLRNIRRLREGAHAVVTGQQAGLFGGPLLAFLKVASALALTAQLERAGVPCVPVFWMASEDHDLAEINQAVLLTQDFALLPFEAEPDGVDGAPIASIRLAEGTDSLVAGTAELLGDSHAADYLRESYRAGETFSNAYARLYARVFAEHGLVLLDPADEELHRIAAPLFAQAISRARELDEALLARNAELREAGYHEQVKVTDLSTPLFTLADGVRVPVHRADGSFSIGREKISAEELARRIEEHPEDFNANVLLRPVLQDYWLPTLAYFGGPAEIAYFAQGGVVYEKLLGRITPILPRLSATLIEARIERLVEKYDVQLAELFRGEQELRDCIAARSLPEDLKDDFLKGKLGVEEAMQRISESVQKLDPTLVRAASKAANKMRYQVSRLEKRAALAELRRNQVIARHAGQIENSLYPRKTLQERQIAALYFYAKYGPELIQMLIEAAQARCPEHKVIHVG